jgi:hypothetical protein
MLRSFLFLAGLAIVVVLLARLGPGALFGLVAGMGWAALVLPVLYAGHHALRTLALAAGLRERGAIGFWRLLLIRLSGEAVQYLTFTGPLLAEPAKAWMLKREGLESADAVGATLTEYVSFTCAASVVSVAGLVALRVLVPLPLAARIPITGTALALTVLLALVGVGLRRRWPMAAWVLSCARRVPWAARGLAVSPEWVRAMELQVVRNLWEEGSRMRRIWMCEGAAQALMVLELGLLFRLFEVRIGPAVLLIIEGVNKVSNFLFFFVPARAGTDEATLVLVTSAIGLPAVVGLGVSLVRRARSLLTGAAGLAAAWALGRRAADRRQRAGSGA